MIEWGKSVLSVHTYWHMPKDKYRIRQSNERHPHKEHGYKYRVHIRVHGADWPFVAAYDTLEEAKHWCEMHHLTGA